MSYFLVVASKDESCRISIVPEGLRLLALNDAQPYILDVFLGVLPEAARPRVQEAYLVEDGSGTTGDVFTEHGSNINISDMDPKVTRLARLLKLAEDNDWLICAWWSQSVVSFVWMSHLQKCLDLLWKQLCVGGNVSVGYLPQWCVQCQSEGGKGGRH